MTSRKILILIAIVAIACAALFLKRKSASNITNASSSGANLIVLGDSIGAAQGVPPDSSFVALLEARYGVTFVNVSATGDNSQSALLRLENDVIRRSPRIVLVEVGGWDLVNNITREETRQNLERIVQKIHAAGAAVVLLGADGPKSFGQMKGFASELADTYRTACVPDILAGIKDSPEFSQADRILPNTNGHKRVAERVGAELERAFPQVFKK